MPRGPERRSARNDLSWERWHRTREPHDQVVVSVLGRLASGFAGRRPEVDPALRRVAVDLGEFRRGELEVPERGEVLLELGHAACPDDRRGHARVAEGPGERHLREALTATLRDLGERTDLGQGGLAEESRRQRATRRGTRAGGDAAKVLAGQQPLREGREDDAADSFFAEDIQQTALDPAVEHRVGRLGDEKRRAELTKDGHGLSRVRRRVRRDPGIEGLAVADRGVEGGHRLLERRLRVEPMGVEDVDVLEAQPTETLVEAGKEVLARAPVAVRPWPHVVAGLRADDQLVPVAAQVCGENSTEVLLRRAVWRAMVVSQVEVGDAQVEGSLDNGPLAVDRPVVPEVLPQSD